MLKQIVPPGDFELVEEIMEDITEYTILKRSSDLGIKNNTDYSFEKVLVFCDLGAYLG